MMHEWSTWKKVALGALGLLGTILIGAIGSGIWQRLGDPLYIWLRDALLNGATLGIATLKDALYAEVATGLYERPASLLLGAFLFSILYAIFILLTFLTLRAKRQGNALDEGRRSGEAVNSEGRRQRALETLRKRLYVLWPITLALAIVIAFSGVRTTYTSRAIGHYRQLTALVGPYISESEMKTYDSRFAQIRSGQDYTDLTRELVELATENGLVIPNFRPW